MSTEACPAPGLCLSLSDRLAKVESAQTERDKMSGRLWTGLMSVLVVSVTNLCVLLLWIGGTNEKLIGFKEDVVANSAAIRRLEQQAQHRTTP